MNRRRRLLGRRYSVTQAVEGEVRKSCRNELQILYSGGPFTAQTWKQLAGLGALSIFEASKLSPVMKDLARVIGPGFRVEGPLAGSFMVAFFAREGRSSRKRIEAVLAASALEPSKVL
jgi:hypothetical protein